MHLQDTHDGFYLAIEDFLWTLLVKIWFVVKMTMFMQDTKSLNILMLKIILTNRMYNQKDYCTYLLDIRYENIGYEND